MAIGGAQRGHVDPAAAKSHLVRIREWVRIGGRGASPRNPAPIRGFAVEILSDRPSCLGLRGGLTPPNDLAMHAQVKIVMAPASDSKQTDLNKEGKMRRITRLASAISMTALFGSFYVTGVAAQEEGERLEARWRLSANPEVQAHIDAGDEALGGQDFGAARNHYNMAAEMMRENGEFPATALHRIASTHYHEGNYQSATAALDALAVEAATYGDIVTQVWALADAAWIFGKSGAKIDMDDRVAKLRRLLSSPYLPYEVRAEVTSKRLGEATTLGTF